MEVDCSGEMAETNDNNNNNRGNNNDNNNISSSRWNPTKEQINMLENLYREGVRTPSAEQIQQITSRLKAYGHIEGKNVFYWFQNHKARQRQKQKQETTFAYLNRYIHHSAVPAATAHCHPNGFYGPCFAPQGEGPMGLYPHQYPKVLVPTVPYKRKLRRDQRAIEKGSNFSSFIVPAAAAHDHDHHHLMNYYYSTSSCMPTTVVTNDQHYCTTFNSNMMNCNETLDLFPLHPTGILDDDQVRAVPSCGENSTAASDHHQGSVIIRPFIDFFN